MMTDADRAYCESVVVAGSHPAKFNTFEIVERIIAEGIEGDFCEAGVAGGGQIAVMDYALRKHNQTRIIHGFDSWEGIPKATDEDDPSQKAEYGIRKLGEPLVSSGKLVSDLNNFWSNMEKWGARKENIRAHKGWFQDTLATAFFGGPMDSTLCMLEGLALLRIDVDLTESVRIVARTLYSFVTSGGYCIFDDWYTSPSSQRQAMVDALTGREEIVHVEDNPGTVWWKKP